MDYHSAGLTGVVEHVLDALSQGGQDFSVRSVDTIKVCGGRWYECGELNMLVFQDKSLLSF